VAVFTNRVAGSPEFDCVDDDEAIPIASCRRVCRARKKKARETHVRAGGAVQLDSLHLNSIPTGNPDRADLPLTDTAHSVALLPLERSIPRHLYGGVPKVTSGGVFARSGARRLEHSTSLGRAQLGTAGIRTRAEVSTGVLKPSASLSVPQASVAHDGALGSLHVGESGL
jgi:hypothetical protein